jgi:hypothetical protein
MREKWTHDLKVETIRGFTDCRSKSQFKLDDESPFSSRTVSKARIGWGTQIHRNQRHSKMLNLADHDRMAVIARQRDRAIKVAKQMLDD